MDPTVGSSEDVPALYRSILGLVEELERCDRRREAAGIRTQAIAAYQTAWDGRQRRRLEQLEVRLRRSLESARRPARSWQRPA